MAEGTALGLSLITLALVFLDAEFPGMARISTILALLAAAMGLIAILRHLFGVEAIYRIVVFSGEFPAALLLFLLGVGRLLKQQRRVLPAVIISDLFGG